MAEKLVASLPRGPGAALAIIAITAVLQFVLLVQVALVLYDDAHVHSMALSCALLAGVVVQLLTIGFVWLRVTEPTMRRNRELVETLSRQRDRMLSFLDHNPDCIAVYDHAGLLIFSNPARTKLFEPGADGGLGRPMTELVDPQSMPAVALAFERALGGNTATTEGRLQTSPGQWIEMDSILFPYVVEGERAGVVVVSKDVSAKRFARAESELQTRRIAALYEIAAAHGRTVSQQIHEALTVAAANLGCEAGVVTEIVEGVTSVRAILGVTSELEVGNDFELAGTLSERIIQEDRVWEAGDLRASDASAAGALTATGWRHLVAMRIDVGGRVFGTFAVGSAVPRSTPLREVDRAFVRVVAALVGTMIERGRQERKLDSLAFFDALTGLPNRVLVRDKLDELIAAAKRHGNVFAVHFIDLDKFKLINDTAGHAAGDKILRLVAGRLQGCIRTGTDLVARLGGDEFLILQANAATAGAAGIFARRIADAFRRPFQVDDRAYQLGCSIGVSIFPVDGTDANTLLDFADQAMYRSKLSLHPEFASSAETVFQTQLPFTYVPERLNVGT